MAAESRFNNDLRYRDEDHPNQTQLTPAYVLDPVREALGGAIDLDPCTEPDNPTGAHEFFCPPVDGAEQPWQGFRIYVNPPYGKARERWVHRCIEAGQDNARVVLLIPAATDTRIFQQGLASASEAVLIRGRVKFGVLRPNRRQVAASHPSALLGWNVDLTPCAHLGMVIKHYEAGSTSSLSRSSEASDDCEHGYLAAGGSYYCPACDPDDGQVNAFPVDADPESEVAA